HSTDLFASSLSGSNINIKMQHKQHKVYIPPTTSLTLFYPFFLSLSLPLSLSHSLSLCYTHTHIFSDTQIHTLCLTHTYIQTQIHKHIISYTDTHSLSKWSSVTSD